MTHKFYIDHYYTASLPKKNYDSSTKTNLYYWVSSFWHNTANWISLARPILASDLPQIAEYNRIEPGAIKTFQPYTAEAFAETIKQELSKIGTEEKSNNSLINLRKKLSISHIFNQHLKLYQDVVKKY